MNGILWFLSHTCNNMYTCNRKHMWTASCDSGQTFATQNTREQHPVIPVKHLQQKIHVNSILWFRSNICNRKIHVNSILWFRSNICNRKYKWTASCDSCQTTATENTCEQHPVILVLHLQQKIHVNGILWFLSNNCNRKYMWMASYDYCPTTVTVNELHPLILVPPTLQQ
jgi:hypothetical protein